MSETPYNGNELTFNVSPKLIINKVRRRPCTNTPHTMIEVRGCSREDREVHVRARWSFISGAALAGWSRPTLRKDGMALVISTLLAVTVVAAAPPARAVVASKPPMGWNSWATFVRCNVEIGLLNLHKCKSSRNPECCAPVCLLFVTGHQIRMRCQRDNLARRC